MENYKIGWVATRHLLKVVGIAGIVGVNSLKASQADVSAIQNSSPKIAAAQLPISVGDTPNDTEGNGTRAQADQQAIAPQSPAVNIEAAQPVVPADTPSGQLNSNLYETEPSVPIQGRTGVGDRTQTQSDVFGTDYYGTALGGIDQMMAYNRDAVALSKKWSVHTTLQLGLIYDDNINLSDHDKKSALVATIGGGIALTVGQPESAFSGTLSYSARGEFLDNTDNQNSLDNDLGMTATWRFPKLTLGINTTFQSITGGSVDVGDRVRRKPFYFGVTTHYPVSDKLSLDVNGDYTLARFSGLLDSTEYRTQSFINYAVTPKLQLGVGGSFGYLDVEKSPGQTYEQALLRVTYNATGKLGLNAFGGEEWRQLGGRSSGEMNNVFGFGISYAARERTTITLDAHRRIYGSAALAGQDYTATGLVLGVRQELSPRMSASLSIGYEHTAYLATESGVTATRKDNYIYGRIDCTYAFAAWLSVGVFYEASNNDSTGFGARSFDRNRAGIYANIPF